MARFLSIRMFRLWNYLTFWQNVAFAACTKCWEANLFSYNNPYFTQNPKWKCVFLKIFFLIKKLILWSTNLFERSFHLVENYLWLHNACSKKFEFATNEHTKLQRTFSENMCTTKYKFCTLVCSDLFVSPYISWHSNPLIVTLLISSNAFITNLLLGAAHHIVTFVIIYGATVNFVISNHRFLIQRETGKMEVMVC